MKLQLLYLINRTNIIQFNNCCYAQNNYMYIYIYIYKLIKNSDSHFELYT